MLVTLAPCGMNCKLCHSYQRAKKPCPGCRGCAEDIRAACRNCAIAKCAKKKDYCYECENFPCKSLKELDGRYRIKYGMSMLENLSRIKETGEKFFDCEQAEKYRCGVCGKLRTVHYDYCIYCKEEKGHGRAEKDT